MHYLSALVTEYDFHKVLPLLHSPPNLQYHLNINLRLWLHWTAVVFCVYSNLMWCAYYNSWLEQNLTDELKDTQPTNFLVKQHVNM